MPLALAFVALALSIWIVVPGPVLPLFALTVGGTELWPLLALFNAFVLVVAIRSGGWARPAAAGFAATALLCSLVPPLAYVLSPVRVPLSALVAPLPLYPGPAHAEPGAPIVLAIYGGAWEHGSPANNALLNAIIASWGYRVVALDYPHAPAARWPAQRAAILRQIDAMPAGPIAVLGHSSGAQLAMIAAAMRPHRITAVVTYESPVDLRMGYEFPSQPDIIGVRTIMSDLCGGTPTQRPGCYRSGSPRYAVHAGMPPVLMIAAGRDHVVNLSFEHLLRDELRADGVSVTYLELPWADHAFEDVPTGFHDRIALWYLRRFLEAHLREP
ncbi:MAG: alpha/beta hydrolase [Vulcanimicrobiaceae bacterium]